MKSKQLKRAGNHRSDLTAIAWSGVVWLIVGLILGLIALLPRTMSVAQPYRLRQRRAKLRRRRRARCGRTDSAPITVNDGAAAGASLVTSSLNQQATAGQQATTSTGIRHALLPLVILAAVAIAETITAYGDPRIGVAAHVLILAVLLALSAVAATERQRAFFLVVAVGPLIRIVSTGMPLLAFPPPLWYVLTSVPLFIAGGLIAHQLGLSRRSLGLCLPAVRHLPIELAVCVSGVGLGVMEWLILRPAPLVNGRSVAWIVAAVFILLVSTGLLEELLFRGLIQHVSIGFLGMRGGILFTAALFAALHIGHRSVLDVIFVAGVGLGFGLAVRRTGSLLGVTLAHGTINIMLFIVLPLTLH